MSLASWMRFSREVKEEARKVTWPSLAETRAMSIMVFILVTIVALFLVGTDLLIGLGLKALLGLAL